MNVLNRIMCQSIPYVVIGCIHGRNHNQKQSESVVSLWENRGARGCIAWFYHSRKVLRQTDEGPVCWFYQVLTFYMPLQRLSILAYPHQLCSIFPYISFNKHGIFTLFYSVSHVRSLTDSFLLSLLCAVLLCNACGYTAMCYMLVLCACIVLYCMLEN